MDNVHLSEAGEKRAARMWADSLNADFFETAEPWRGLIAKSEGIILPREEHKKNVPPLDFATGQ